MTTIVDLTDADGKTSRTQLRRAARRTREARANFWRACILSSFFIVVIGANLYIGAVVIVGHMRAAAADGAAASHKTARFTRPLGDTIFCQYTVFDNNSAQSLDSGIERCDSTSRMAQRPSKSKFNWGGK
jgi:hypothetical protein